MTARVHFLIQEGPDLHAECVVHFQNDVGIFGDVERRRDGFTERKGRKSQFGEGQLGRQAGKII